MSLSEKESSFNLVSFEKIDSIKINYLGNATIHDLDPVSKTIVFLEHRQSSEDIFIADFNGVILSNFSKFGDMPDSYGKLLSTIRITDNNSFIVYGYKGLITYNFNGEIQSKVKLDDFQFPSQMMIAMGFGMEKLGDSYFYINQEQPPTNLDLLKSFPLLKVINPNNRTIEPIITFPDESIFVSGRYFFIRSWFPVYDIKGDHIYIVFGSEPVIYVYKNKHPFNLVTSIPFTLRNYNQFKGLDMGSDETFGYSMIKGIISNVKKIDEYFVVAYFPGYDDLDSQTNFENKSPEESKLFRERMLKKYPSRIAILDTLGNVLNDFVPEGLEPSSMLLRDGQLWMMEKPNEEEERDYFRLFRVGLKFGNK